MALKSFKGEWKKITPLLLASEETQWLEGMRGETKNGTERQKPRKQGHNLLVYTEELSNWI